MRFTTEASELVRAVSRAVLAVERSAIPILGHVLIEADDGFVRVSGTNMDLTVSESVELADAGSPAVLRDPADPTALHVLMPIRV